MLALGIGASTAIFTVIDAAMLRPLPYPDPEQLVTVYVEEVGPTRVSSPTPSMDDMRLWQQQTDVFAAVAGWGTSFGGRIVDGPEPERIRVLQFTEDYLRMHWVTPLIGRDFTRDDLRDESPAVALLGYGYWKSHYGGRRDVIGQTIRLDDGIATIVGVLPAWFHADTPVCRPLRIRPEWVPRRGTGQVSVYGRLRPGMTIEQATERLSARMPALTLRNGSRREVRVAVHSRLEIVTASRRTTATILAGGVGLILLLACVNVAGLLLAHGWTRKSEMAVRTSLGAGRTRLARQLLTESFVLALAGGGAGLLLARLSLDTIVANIPITLSSDSPARLSLQTLAATVALLLPTTLLFGLAPAMLLSRVRISPTLARGGRHTAGSLSRRESRLLIAAEVALAVVLSTGAALMIRSFARLSAVDLGFNAEGLVTMEVMPLAQDPAAHRTYYATLLDRLAAMPGVASVGGIDNFPLGGATSFTGVSADGKSVGIAAFEVLPRYFETCGVPVRSGRLPTRQDYAAGRRVAVLGETAARAIFGNQPAVGRQLTRASEAEPWQVVAVVGDVRHGGPLSDPARAANQVFFYEQPKPEFIAPMVIVLRPSARIPDLAGRLRRTAGSLGPRVLVERIRSGNDWFADRVVTPRQRTVLLSLLGGLGLVLAFVGVFGATAYAVARRTSEIGVRMAFGAAPGQMVRMVIRDSAVPVAIGIVAGLGGAAAATRVIASFLFDTRPIEPATFGIVAGALAVAGCLAAAIPARRASRVDPATTLRAE